MHEIPQHCPIKDSCSRLSGGILAPAFYSVEEQRILDTQISQNIPSIRLCQKENGSNCVLNSQSLRELLDTLKKLLDS